jgi:hypothetical protein
MDPSVRAAAGAAADAAFNSALGAAAAAAVAAAGAAAAAWPAQVAANYLCLLETARVLLAAPHDISEEQQAQVGVPQFLPCSYSACGSMLVQLAPGDFSHTGCLHTSCGNAGSPIKRGSAHRLLRQHSVVLPATYHVPNMRHAQLVVFQKKEEEETVHNEEERKQG